MAAAHKGKALVLRWLGARQRLYMKSGLGEIPLQCKIYFLFNLATLYSLRIIASIAIILIYTRYYSKKVQTLLLK